MVILNHLARSRSRHYRAVSMLNKPNHKSRLVSNGVVTVVERILCDISDVQAIINQLYSDMLFNRSDCSYRTEKKLDETLRIIRRVFTETFQWPQIFIRYFHYRQYRSKNPNKSVAKIK